MFEKAARMKLRFDVRNGMLAAEDLWDLPLTSTRQMSLDDIARSLHRQLKNGDDVSFVEPDRKSDETIQLKFNIVKHIIDMRLAENAAAKQAKERADMKQKIMSIIVDKQNEALRGKPLEELQQMMNSL